MSCNAHEFDLHNAQIQFEEESTALGQARYMKNLRHHQEQATEDETGPVMQLIRRSVETVAEAVAIKLERKGPGRRLKGLSLIEGQDPHMMALHVLRAALSSVSSPDRQVTAVASATGKAILEEINYGKWAEQDKKSLELTQKVIKGPGTFATPERTVRKAFQKADVQGIVEWPHEHVVEVGMVLLDALLGSTTLFRVQNVTKGRGRTLALLQATDETIAWITKAHARAALFAPVRMPMVVPPRPWESVYGGGYLTDLGGRAPIIKSRNKHYLAALNDVDMPQVYAAINAVQSTAWRINERVLRVAVECWDQGIEVGSGMPARDPIPMPTPARPLEERAEWKAADPAGYKSWAMKCAAVHDDNSKLISKRTACGTKLNLGQKFLGFPELYFPHQMDFRGRIYPMPAHLNPQSDDLARGLLMFAEGKPLGERGVYWLKVHLANCFGVDKVSFEERAMWTEDHMFELIDSGTDPMGGARFWMQADDPFQALAACFDLARVASEGSTIVSHLSIPMDGTCNGLQNFSALLRDPIGGKATNLVPGDKPSDIYAEVAKVVADQVRIDAAAGNKYAMVWDGRINRKIVKQPVMTLPYGATERGMSQQIEAALLKTYGQLFPSNETWQACAYLAGVTYRAIGTVVVAATSAMTWLRSVAKLAASSEYPLRWTTPAGLPVLQEYREMEGRRMNIFFGGRRIQLMVSRTGDKLDKRRQSQGISPNLIHSYDASHLMATVNLAVSKGLKSFSMIHDSYGTHAADTDLMHECIREAFVQQYSGDLLGDFAANVAEQITPDMAAKIPAVPEMGTLDLEVIKSSRYFFA